MSDYTIYLIDNEFNRVDGCPNIYGHLYVDNARESFSLKKYEDPLQFQ